MVERRRGETKLHRTWMWELGFRVYAGRPYCVLAQVDYFGRPRRWSFILDDPPDGLTVWEYLERECEALLTRDKRPVPAGASQGTLVDVKFQKIAPTVWDILTQSKWEDGSPRETGSMMFFVQDGCFKAMLRDKDAGCVLWVAAPSIFGAVEALEAAVSSATADWRVDRQAGGGVAKKGRK